MQNSAWKTAHRPVQNKYLCQARSLSRTLCPSPDDRLGREETSTSGGKHGIQWTASMQFDDLDFADDRTLPPHTQQQMQEKTISLAAVSAVHATIEAMDGVKHFTYLGSIIGEHGESDADVDVGISKAEATYLHMKNI
ncbi:unnamed protein product [Schistosoma curassoni]|uniref:NTP_transf_2 domain-containing protein n=1 Tax=Schistosoma curassoni TaxID=6186 RepID=A0A183JT15_9TREM|nr:unnamed protein product [Schistosoma curassoni]